MLAAVATIALVVFFVSTPNGTTIDPSGAVIDAIAVVILVVGLWSLWRDRRAHTLV